MPPIFAKAALDTFMATMALLEVTTHLRMAVAQTEILSDMTLGHVAHEAGLCTCPK